MTETSAAPFLGRWSGTQYVRGTRGDGRPHFEAPKPHTVRIAVDDGGVFLAALAGRVPLFVIGPTAAVIQAVDLACTSRSGVRARARISGGSVHRVGDVLAFSFGASIDTGGDIITGFFVFEGKRAEQRTIVARDLH